MKRFLVLGLTGLLVLGLFVLGAVFSPRSQFGPEMERSRNHWARDSALGDDVPLAPAPERSESATEVPEPEANEPSKVAEERSFKALEQDGRGEGGRFAKLLVQKPSATRVDQTGEGKEQSGKKAAGEFLADRGGEEGQSQPVIRAWFPETFLFEPLVVTDESGQAAVPVRVPDRLTSWRVLALAHSRGGAQAGAVTRFAGTLPTYVDPVVPPFLLAGDEVRLPVQVVNTTGAAVSASLQLQALNALLSSSGGPVNVGPGASRVEFVTLKTPRPGTVGLMATLGGADSIQRTLEVKPAGRPVSLSKGGTLASTREFTLLGPSDALPDSERVRLLVFPGALALLRSELSGALHRGGVAEDAYALLLAGRAPSLLRALGDEADLEAVRSLSLLGAQRALQHARAPEVSTATLLAEAALAHPENPVLSRLGERLASTVSQRQRPDGTCEGGAGWTLQRVLVATADCVQAVRSSMHSSAGRQRAAAVSVRAMGAFERNLERVQDGYTAAAILASGAVEGEVAARLRQKVKDALKATSEGAQVLTVPPGVQRADGRAPTEVEATGLAALALLSDSSAPLADLGTTLLGAYHPSFGWGDGRANLTCLRAVVALFKEPIPSEVKIFLERDGQPVADGKLDPSKLKEVVAIEAPALGSSGSHQWTVRAEPAVAGLGFALALQAYVPWKKETSASGLELLVNTVGSKKVGQPVQVEVTATAPSKMPLRIRHPLPAGVQPSAPSLQALVDEGTLTGFRTEDGAVILEAPPRPSGQPLRVRFQVVPTLAGTLQSDAARIEPSGRPELAHYVPTPTWMISP